MRYEDALRGAKLMPPEDPDVGPSPQNLARAAWSPAQLPPPGPPPGAVQIGMGSRFVPGGGGGRAPGPVSMALDQAAANAAAGQVFAPAPAVGSCAPFGS